MTRSAIAFQAIRIENQNRSTALELSSLSPRLGIVHLSTVPGMKN
jgi:hypothetical protein